MTEPADARRSLLAGIGVVVVAAILAWFSARPYAGSWNDGSRLATVECLVDGHALAIDHSVFVEVPRPPLPAPYPAGEKALLEVGTGDKLFIGGHYYSDKSPVPAVLLAAAYQLWQWTTGSTARADPNGFCHAMTLASSGVSYVLAVLAIYVLGGRLRLSLGQRVLLTASFALATVALPYARQVNNHILLLAVAAWMTVDVAAMCLFSPLPCTQGRGAGGEGSEPCTNPHPSPQPLSPEYRGEGLTEQAWPRLLRLGLLGGLAYTIDLGTGPVLLACTALLVVVRCRRVAPLAAFAVAALPWLALHHALNYAIAGTWRPANAIPEYLAWPGSPFSARNMTGGWAHAGPGSFLLYAMSMLFGKRGFIGHNTPLFLALPAAWMLLRQWRTRPAVVWAAACCGGTWLLYAAASNNSSGQCLSIRWFVPLLAPAYFLLGAWLVEYPRYWVYFVVLSAWGFLQMLRMGQGPWSANMVPAFWPLQMAALLTWAGIYLFWDRKRTPPALDRPAERTRRPALAAVAVRGQ